MHGSRLPPRSRVRQVFALPIFALLSLASCHAATHDAATHDAATESDVSDPSRKSSFPVGDPDGAVDVATFGGGCFWCTEAVFQEVDGVLSVTSGYSGGAGPNPTYEEVCGGETGHAEAVQVRFDPKRVSYAAILEIFFRTHDPTTLNRQGADVGTQYRSVIFTHSEPQRATAEEVKQALNASGAYDDPIVTEITAFEAFYPAEEYHQGYFAANPRQPYCRAVIQPKLEKFRKVFEDRLKPR